MRISNNNNYMGEQYHWNHFHNVFFFRLMNDKNIYSQNPIKIQLDFEALRRQMS